MTEQRETQINPIQQSFEPLIGLPAWLVRKGHASCLTLEFGQPHLEVREPVLSSSNDEQVRRILARRRISPRGEWHLWVYCCNWRVLCAGNEVAWSEAPDEAIRKAANEIDGRLLTGINIDSVNQTSEFAFEFEIMIQMWPYDDNEDSPQWMLFMPSGDVLTYRSDGRYSLGPGNKPPDEEKWQTLT